MLSKDTDLRRRVDELEWMKEYITYKKDVTSPLGFLEAFAHYQKTKTQRIKNLSVALQATREALETVKPDIVVQGNLSITSESQPVGNLTQISLKSENPKVSSEFSIDVCPL